MGLRNVNTATDGSRQQERPGTKKVVFAEVQATSEKDTRSPLALDVCGIEQHPLMPLPGSASQLTLVLQDTDKLEDPYAF
ncbi:hypothetical protein [Arthrobacter sp. B1I2]|uniref:hypothetical protein n=1 Tax=Arthrobacter sp. B1I2 TaxID=3042263 RepID=UPI00278A977B|nr:hypothetical protein [Arthrobacter sp. B1I2]MDQ0733201.1 hypothetical protein [Arthrobacter sp. B1I2]